MNYLPVILATLTTISILGGIVAYFARSRGVETIGLLEKNVEAYKEAVSLKDQRIAYLEGQLTNANETIKNLNATIKELKDGSRK